MKLRMTFDLTLEERRAVASEDGVSDGSPYDRDEVENHIRWLVEDDIAGKLREYRTRADT